MILSTLHEVLYFCEPICSEQSLGPSSRVLRRSIPRSLQRPPSKPQTPNIPCLQLACNRAAAHMKTGAYANALADCDAALQMDPEYTKVLAFSRCSLTFHRVFVGVCDM